jgi:hypothetical protein
MGKTVRQRFMLPKGVTEPAWLMLFQYDAFVSDKLGEA